MFTVVFCIFLTIAILCLLNILYYKKLYIPAVKHSYQRKEQVGTFWFILNLGIATLLFLFWYNLQTFVYKWFDMHEPICIEHIGTYPIAYHWSNPDILFINIPEDSERFFIENLLSEEKGHKYVKPGKRFYLGDLHHITINEKGFQENDKILVNFYIFRYKSWGPFTVPKFLNPGLASIGVPEIYNIGKCEIHATLKE